jgi:hypothetical protein
MSTGPWRQVRMTGMKPINRKRRSTVRTFASSKRFITAKLVQSVKVIFWSSNFLKISQAASIVGRHGDDLNDGTRTETFSELSGRGVPQLDADKRDRFIENVVGGDKRESISPQPSRNHAVITIATVGGSVPAAGIDEDAFHERTRSYCRRRR